MKPGKPVHPSNGTGTAPDAATLPGGIQVSFDEGPNKAARASTLQVVITNREAAQNLEVSFADGRDGYWFAIAPNTTLPFPVSVFRLYLRGASGGTAAYSVIGVV